MTGGRAEAVISIKQPLFCKSRYEQAGHLAFMLR